MASAKSPDTAAPPTLLNQQNSFELSSIPFFLGPPLADSNFVNNCEQQCSLTSRRQLSVPVFCPFLRCASNSSSFIEFAVQEVNWLNDVDISPASTTIWKSFLDRIHLLDGLAQKQSMRTSLYFLFYILHYKCLPSSFLCFVHSSSSSSCSNSSCPLLAEEYFTKANVRTETILFAMLRENKEKFTSSNDSTDMGSLCDQLELQLLNFLFLPRARFLHDSLCCIRESLNPTSLFTRTFSASNSGDALFLLDASFQHLFYQKVLHDEVHTRLPSRPHSIRWFVKETARLLGLKSDEIRMEVEMVRRKETEIEEDPQRKEEKDENEKREKIECKKEFESVWYHTFSFPRHLFLPLPVSSSSNSFFPASCTSSLLQSARMSLESLHSSNLIPLSLQIFPSAFTKIGFVVWPAARLLNEFLLCSPSLFAGRTLLELGSGSGISTIVAHATQARQIIATDYEEGVIENAWQNIRDNVGRFCGARLRSGQIESSQIVEQGKGNSRSLRCSSCDCCFSVCKLDWYSYDRAFLRNLHADVIIAADTAYVMEDVSALARVVWDFLSVARDNGNAGVAYLVQMERSELLFVEYLSAFREMGMKMEEIDRDKIPQTFPYDRTHIFIHKAILL